MRCIYSTKKQNMTSVDLFVDFRLPMLSGSQESCQQFCVSNFKLTNVFRRYYKSAEHEYSAGIIGNMDIKILSQF